MSLYGAEVHHFTEREIEIIRTIASQASVAISNALLYEQIAKARDELEAKVLERTHDLAETNEQLAAILSGINDGISVVDRDLKITWVNDVEAIRFGERGSLLGYHCQEIYRCAAESCGEYPAKITLDSGQIAKSILTAVLPDGDTHYYEVITSPIYDVFTTGGEIHVAKVLQIARDITESRHMQDQIAEYTRKLENMVEDRTAELQRKNEELESFVFTVSHDLKAPIVSIQGFAANLAREYGPSLEGDGEFYLQRIRKNTEQLQSLIQELLELSRIGRLPEPWEMVDINELVADVGAELQFQLENNHINFIIEPNLPKAVCQRKRFRQVFVNLIDNAIRYRGTNENPFIKVSASDLGDVWEFCVQDSGVGIAPENKRKIFQIFQRLYKVPDAKDGAGVGLAIVKKIVETHGGLIRVESEGEGLGSSFIFTLPKREQIVSEEEA
jgi:signal transduction histidine kinase